MRLAAEPRDEAADYDLCPECNLPFGNRRREECPECGAEVCPKCIGESDLCRSCERKAAKIADEIKTERAIGGLPLE